MNHLLDTLPRSAISECGQINGLRVWGRVVAFVLMGTVVASFFIPWTQSARGDGSVIAFSPQDRETPIRAPLNGRVVRWYVGEGDRVEKGAPIAELSDNDPNRVLRLGQTADAVRAQRDALDSAITIARLQVRALEQARDAALEKARLEIRIAEDKTDETRQKLVAARAKQRTARINLRRQKTLNAQDLSSDRQLELADLAMATATTDVERTRANLRAAERKIKSARARRVELRKSNLARIEKARAELAKLEAKRSDVTASLAKAESQLSRQRTQTTLTAPRAGRILSVRARQGSEYVKAGQELAVLVPETGDRAVELWVNGNDAPLIRDGQQVRLQFEGWPAVQFVGWPSAAVGTFAGKVAFVDAAARRDGRFRVVVIPSDSEGSWPSATYLRQGVKVRGWVLLNRVSVAYEIWRQLNGFPPAVAPPTAAVNGGSK
jgi:multidrug efflux pump subunit AcrA (membrane-fusion protein)